MKTTRFAFFAALALMMASCDTEDDNTTIVPDTETEEQTDTLVSYSGDLTVTMSGVVVTETPDSCFTVELDSSNNTADITMVAISFVTGMPELTLDLVAVPYTESNGVISFDQASIIPEYDGLPYESREVTDFTATIEDGGITIDFTCIGFVVNYVGLAQ